MKAANLDAHLLIHCDTTAAAAATTTMEAADDDEEPIRDNLNQVPVQGTSGSSSKIDMNVEQNKCDNEEAMAKVQQELPLTSTYENTSTSTAEFLFETKQQSFDSMYNF